MDIAGRKLMMVTKRVIHKEKKKRANSARACSLSELTCTVNDLQNPNGPQNEPQMVLDRK